ncbi:uncharacterized protein LOC131971075 [Centropristis striata]|uniref:uncharacterized protein LOC131971075 n=1 Tax=Centropristis striata TaxID=184440 RepID=UPI0027DF4666|nr:uncharacterized protein LOC131971075 [Centropristis striata]
MHMTFLLEFTREHLETMLNAFLLQSDIYTPKIFAAQQNSAVSQQKTSSINQQLSPAQQNSAVSQQKTSSINQQLSPAHAVLRREAEVKLDGAGLIEMIDTYDRPEKTFTAGTYSGAGVYADGFEDKPGKRLPKAGVYAGAGVGLFRAQQSIFEVEAKGPNASAGAGVSLTRGAKAFAKAEVASASYAAGPLKAKVGLAVDTGASIGPTGVEMQFLGTGVTIGPRMAFNVLGNGFEFNLW